jgi:hypothetical protein
MTRTAPLPTTLELAQLHLLGLHGPDTINVYERILRAEAWALHHLHRAHQTGAQILLKEANENVVCARVAGYLFLELCAQHNILGGQQSTKLMNEIMSSPLDHGGGDVGIVFKIGRRYRDHLIRACAFNYFPVLVV